MSQFPPGRAGLCLLSSAFLWLAAPEAARAQDWIPLFDGTNITQWSHVGDGGFELENGLLKTRGGMGLLWYTPQKFGNVRIRVIYKGSIDSNSGVFIRIPDVPVEPMMPVNRGYEVQIDYRADEYHVTGVLYSLTRAKSPPPRNDGWNELLITLDGNRTRTEVNGVLITDYRDGDPVPPKAEGYEPDRGPRPDTGYIGLQNHSDEDTIYYKEISYQPLSR